MPEQSKDSTTKILVITDHKIGKQIAGPAIRAIEIANQLSQFFEVRVVTTGVCEEVDLPFWVGKAAGKKLRSHSSWADLVIFQGFVLATNPWLAKTSKILVADLYDPMHLEHLAETPNQEIRSRTKAVRQTLGAIAHQLLRADLILCASPKQRDYWIGYMSGLGRVNPSTYSRNSLLADLIIEVPFGLPTGRPTHNYSPLRSGSYGIRPDQKLIVWGGGIYNWFDPLTLISSIKILEERGRDVSLFFMGTSHPDSNSSESQMLVSAMELADKLGLTGTRVHFNEEWVPYEERSNYLLDSDAGASTHFQNLETIYSFRTRILDYLWAELPIITTEGDSFGDLVRDKNLGVVVGEKNVIGLADGIELLLYDREFFASAKENIKLVKKEFTWDAAVKPLVDFCLNPTHAGDFQYSTSKIPSKFRNELWINGKLRGATLAFKVGGLKSVISKLLHR